LSTLPCRRAQRANTQSSPLRRVLRWRRMAQAWPATRSCTRWCAAPLDASQWRQAARLARQRVA
jgi:hypothetical protein